MFVCCLFFCFQLCYAIFHILKKDWKRIATLFCLLLYSFRFFFVCFVVLLPLHLVYFDYQQALKILKLTEISAIQSGSAWNCSLGITFTVFIRLSSNLTGWLNFVFRTIVCFSFFNVNGFLTGKWRQIIYSKIKSSISDVNNR